METITMMSNFGDEVSGAIKFENPFFEPISIAINLVQSEKSFAFLKNYQRLSLKPLEYVFVSVNYSPQTMIKSKATVEISYAGHSSDFIWKYNLEGIPIIQYHRNLELRPKARQKHSQKFELLIEHIPWDEGELKFGLDEFKNNFSLEIMDVTRQITFPGLQILDWSDKLKNVGLVLSKCSNVNANGACLLLELLIELHPELPNEESFEIIIKKKQNLAIWKFPLKIKIAPSTPDDIIVIRGNAGKISLISFNIHNKYQTDLDFHAYFYKGPIDELSIKPSKGVLTKLESKKFTLRFQPRLYAKTTTRILIIEVLLN